MTATIRPPQSIGPAGPASTVPGPAGPAGVGLLAGSADPSAGAGVAATLGYVYARVNGSTGELWIKIGVADTDWVQAVTTG